MGSEYLFVYGTLRKGVKNEMSELLARNGKLIGTGTTNGVLYRINWYVGVVKSNDPSQVVYGDLYEISKPKRTLARLDDYEACSDVYPQPWEYLRVKRSVTMSDGKKLKAWVYLYNLPVKGLKKIPSGDFLDDE